MAGKLENRRCRQTSHFRKFSVAHLFFFCVNISQAEILFSFLIPIFFGLFLVVKRSNNGFRLHSSSHLNHFHKLYCLQRTRRPNPPDDAVGNDDVDPNNIIISINYASSSMRILNYNFFLYLHV